MSKFKPIRCLESSIPEEISDGALYITTDTEQLFVDTDSKRLAIKDVITVEDEASLPLAPVKGKLYVALSEKSLWVFTTEWVQIGSGSGGGGYVLPVASKDTLGGVKIDGTSIIISDDGTISSINNESENTNIAGIAPIYTYDTGYASTVYGEYTYSSTNYYYIVGDTTTVPWTYDNYNTTITFGFGTIDTKTNQFKPDLSKYAYTIRDFKDGDALNNSNGRQPGGSGVTNGSYFRYIIGTLNSDGTFIPKIIVADPTSGSDRYDTYYTFYHIDDYTIQENTSGDIEITPTSTTVINQVHFWTGSTGVAANGINFYENADGSITFGVWNSSNERYVTSNPRNSINFNSLNLNCVFYRCNMTSEVPTNTISLSTNINITDADNNVVWTPSMTEKTTKILLKFTDNFINQDGVLDVNTNVTIQGNEFNVANKLVQLDSSGKLPALDASNLTNLPGGNIATIFEAVDVENNDSLDTFTTGGIYYFTSSTTNANKPIDDISGVLEVIPKESGDGIVQRFTRLSTVYNGCWVRTALNTTGTLVWEEWKELISSPATTTTVGIVKPDGTTITVDEDGTIHSTSSAPTNMVTTDTSQTINGQKEFKKTILSLDNNLIRGQQSEAYRNGAGLSMGANVASTDGGAFAPQWKMYSTTGSVERVETIITTYNQSVLKEENFNAASKLVRLDADAKLPAIDGSQLTNLPSSDSYTKSEVDTFLADKQDKFAPFTPLRFEGIGSTANNLIVQEDGFVKSPDINHIGLSDSAFSGNLRVPTKFQFNGNYNGLDTSTLPPLLLDKYVGIPYTPSIGDTFKLNGTYIYISESYNFQDSIWCYYLLGHLDENNVFKLRCAIGRNYLGSSCAIGIYPEQPNNISNTVQYSAWTYAKNTIDYGSIYPPTSLTEDLPISLKVIQDESGKIGINIHQDGYDDKQVFTSKTTTLDDLDINYCIFTFNNLSTNYFKPTDFSITTETGAVIWDAYTKFPDKGNLVLDYDNTFSIVNNKLHCNVDDNVITSDNISQDAYIQSLEARIAALEALIDGGSAESVNYRTYYTVVGNPTISEDFVLTNTGNGNYISTEYTASGFNSIEISFDVLFTDFNSTYYFTGQVDDHNYTCPQLASGTDRTLNLACSYNGSSWLYLHNTDVVLELNTRYNIKTGWNITDKKWYGILTNVSTGTETNLGEIDCAQAPLFSYPLQICRDQYKPTYMQTGLTMYLDTFKVTKNEQLDYQAVQKL